MPTVRRTGRPGLIDLAARARVPVIVAPPTSDSRDRSLSTELARIAALRESGVLTEEEFAAAKARLLRR